MNIQLPIMPTVPMIQTIGKNGSILFSSHLALPVPIVPKTYLLNVVVISSKEVIGTYKRIYARKSFNCLGIDMGTRRFLCVKN
jgi:hypothetical protein